MEEQDQESDYIVFPEEAIQYLPEEWRQNLQALKQEGQGILASVDDNLKIVNRIIHAFPTVISLRYIQHRLASTEFQPSMEWVLENDMLTLAFVTTYTRLVEGGIGSGVSRSALPADLRPIHDRIIELRNKRYAHNAGHGSIEGTLAVRFGNGSFDLSVNFNMGSHIGGMLEWERLAAFLDELLLNRLRTQLEKLKEKTGRDWTFASGPAPIWAKSDLESGAATKLGGAKT